MTFDPKDHRGPRGGFLLRDQIRSFDGIDLHRAREPRSDRTVLVKVVKDRNLQEIAHWEHVALGLVEHPLVIRPLEIARDERDHALYAYTAESFALSERSDEATMDGDALARLMLEIVAALHARGIVRLGLDTSCFWLRPRDGVLAPVLVALKSQPQLPWRETYRPSAPPHERPRHRSDIAFVSPEALLGEETDARSDLYAVGAVLYEMLTGLPPVSADDVWTALQNRASRTPAPLSEVRPDVSEPLARVVARLLSFSPSERYPTALATLEALGAGPEAVPARAAGALPAPALLSPDFVGRADALARLESAFESAASGHVHTVMVAGDEGLGKTRLVDEFLARLKLRGVASYRGRFLPDERSLYFLPFAELVRASHPPGRRVPDEVERVVTHLFPDLLPAARQRPRGRRGPAGPPRREEIVETLARLVLSLQPAAGPTCLVLEQWAGDDPDHRMLLEGLLERLAGKPVLLLCTLRPGTEPLAEEASPEGGREDRIDLGPVGAREIARVAASALAQPDLPEGRGASLHDESHGSPLMCLELLKLAAHPVAFPEGEEPIVMGPEDVVARRLAGLPDDARLVLEAGAVLGQAFERQALVRVAELPEDDVWSHLGRLVALDFLRATVAGGRLELAFPHPIYRRSVLKAATPARRSLLHMRTGHYVESKFKRGASETIWDIAYHFARGSEDVKKARYGALAADHAAELFATEAALRFFKSGVMTGVADDKLARVKPKIEGLLALAGREAEVRSLCDAAPQAAAGTSTQDLPSLLGEGRQSLAATEYRKAAKLLSIALERSTRDADGARAAEAACLLGTLQRRLGAYGRAAEALQRALPLAGADGHFAALARVDLGRALHLQGRLDAARQHYAEALEVATRLHEPNMEGYCRSWVGRLLVSEGRMDEALKELLAAQQIVARGGDQSGAAWVALALGAYFEDVRNDTEALAHYELAQRGAGEARTRVRGMVGAARSFTRLDRIQDAEAKVQAALESCQAPGAYDLAWQVHTEAGRAYRISGRLEEALSAYMRSATAIEALMDQAPLGRGERAGFLRHDGRLKAFRGLLAVRLLIDKHPSLIEFAADDYLIALIERHYDDRYRQRKKLSERLERMVEWLLRNREQIRIRRAAPVVAPQATAAAAAPPPERVIPPRVPKADRLEGKNLLRMAAVLGTLGDPEALKAHLLDMALDVLDADRGAIAMLEGGRMKADVARELKGREVEVAAERLEALTTQRDLEDVGPVFSTASREAGAPPVVLLPLVKGDTLKGGIYVEGPTVSRATEHDKKYLKGLASIAVLALDTAREYARTLAEAARLTRENRKLQQDASRPSRGGRGEEDGAEVPEAPPRRGRDRGRDRDRGRSQQPPPERVSPPEEPRPVEAGVEAGNESGPPSDEGSVPLVPPPVGEELQGPEAAGDETGEQRLSRRARRAQEKQEIVDALKAVEWNRKEAAVRLGISRSTLNAKMRRYNVRIKRLRDLEEMAAGGAVAAVGAGMLAAGGGEVVLVASEEATPDEGEPGPGPADDVDMTSADAFDDDDAGGPGGAGGESAEE